MKRSVLLAALALALPLASFSQEFRGNISGAITDATGAVIAGAKVTVTEVNTGTKMETVSDNGGNYGARFLLAGDYDITVRMNGFKEFIRKGVHVGAGDAVTINMSLQIGDSAQSIEVIADAPLLNQENASVGQVVTTKDVEDLPSNGGTPMMLVASAPGVISTNQPTQVLPFASGGAAAFSMGGMPNQTNELLADGVPNTTWDGRLAYSAPKEAVQQVMTRVFDTDATYGRTAGGTANVILKSGANAFHGTAAWYNQPSNLVANDFFNNAAGIPTQITHFNQGSAAVSGPMILPKIFDGRNRVFWLFAFEDIQSNSPAAARMWVPTDAMRNGDLSQFAALYDPATAVPGTGSTINRTQFAGNKIPASRMNPIALKYLQYFPQPNITIPDLISKNQNFGSDATTKDGFTNELGRLDFNIGQKSRTYFNVRHTDYSQTKNNYFHNLSTGSNLSRSNWGGSLDQVYLINATNILNIRANYTRMFEDHAAPSAGFDPTTLGFPSYLESNSQYLQLPMVSFSSNSKLPSLGMSGANTLPSQSMQLFGSWNMMKGSHNVKIGADLRQYRLNITNYGNATGQFSFSGNSWVRKSSGASSTVVPGQDYGSFLLGLPYAGSGSVYDINASAMFYSYYTGIFVQDDWRIRRNLTLNIGIRYDHDFPYHERWGRSVNGFDSTATNPLAAAAVAAYNAAPPSVSIPLGTFNVLGGLTFADTSNSQIFRNSSNLISPRFGFAWTPDVLKGKTVIRGGVGLFVAGVSIAQLGTNGKFSTNPLLAQWGFSQSTPYKDTGDNYLTPLTNLSDPFPSSNSIRYPVGAAKGLATFAGQTISFLNPDMKSPYSVRWSFGFQHTLMENMSLEVLYMGSHSVHVPVAYTQLNGIARNLLSTKGTRDQPLITILTGSTANPFKGLDSAQNGSKATIAQLAARFPQFPVSGAGHVRNGTAGISMFDYSVGSSFYNGLNTKLTKRFSSGVQLTFGYGRSRVIERTTWLNDSDPVPEKRVSPFDRPTRVNMMGSYELPVGKGKLIDIRSGWLNHIVGGWKIAGTYTYQTGMPLFFSDSDYVYYGGKLNSNPRNVDGEAFNTSAFETTSANQFQYHLRTFSTSFFDVRADGINDISSSILKTFQFGEGGKFAQLKCDAFNVINHPVFDLPNISSTNKDFGTISAQANRPRMLQLGLRIGF